MKLETHDDSFETSDDLLMPSNNTSTVSNSAHRQSTHPPPPPPPPPPLPPPPVTQIPTLQTTQQQQQAGSQGPLASDNVKCEKLEDPYSFIEEEPMPILQQHPQHDPQQQQILSHHEHHVQTPSLAPCMDQLQQPPIHALNSGPKKRGRKKKIKTEESEFNSEMNGISRPIKERKKHDRFNGMPEEEVSKRTLPDHLTSNLDIIIIGINPGLFAAYKGHHYAGPGNHFWKCLYLSGLTQQQMSADEDYKLLQIGIGFTNMVSRATKGSADLTRKEIKEGSHILLEKLRKFQPKIAVFNGKLIYEVFSGKKDFKFGRQPDLVDGTNTYMWVMPSSSARCAQLPRAADKVPFYSALKKFKDYLNGLVGSIDESELVFAEPRVKSCYEAEPKGDDPFSSELTDISNAVIKKEEGTVVPCKKKRGRPKKIKLEGEELPPQKPVIRKPPIVQNNCDFPKKKRGRPKKIKLEEQEQQLHQKQQQQQQQQQPSSQTRVTMDNNAQTNMPKCFTGPSPIQSPNSFYQMAPALTPPSSASNLYPPQHPPAPYCQSPRPQYSQSPRPAYNSQSPRPGAIYNSQSPRPPFSQSPRPHSQPFTHSDLSSEISAAISSEQLGSPASPSLGPPDFEPPTSMAEESECRLSSPAPSTPSEPHYPYHGYVLDSAQQGVVPGSGVVDSQPQQMEPIVGHHYPSPRHPHQQQQQQPQDMASKSLSGLESLVDQIPSITESDAPIGEAGGGTSDQYQFSNYNRASPVPYNYATGSGGYPIYPTPTWSSPYEPVPLAYPQLPYAQSYAPGIHVPSPNYPYYSYPQPTHPPGYPPYLGGF